jgi:hypothetical protein
MFSSNVKDLLITLSQSIKTLILEMNAYLFATQLLFVSTLGILEISEWKKIKIGPHLT